MDQATGTEDTHVADVEYARAEEERPVGHAIADVIGFEPEDWAAMLGGKSDEWWAEHDRKIAEVKARSAAALEEQRIIERSGELADNGFPALFIAAARADAPIDTTAMRQARVFVHLPKKLLVLAGGVGTGKTTAATWVALRGSDPRPGFIRATELERRGRYDKGLNEWLEDKTSLVIDDVGAEVLDGKGVFRSLLDEVVDMFYGNRRTLVMTTNLRPRCAEPKQPDEGEQFKERYGDRVWSRIGQVGVWGDCGTRDLRKEIQP